MKVYLGADVFSPNFQPGETYECAVNIEHHYAFFFCYHMQDLHKYYKNSMGHYTFDFRHKWTRVYEVEVDVLSRHTKQIRQYLFFTNKITVIRQVPISECPNCKFDERGNLTYWEDSQKEEWQRVEYDEGNNWVYFEDKEHWVRQAFDKNGNRTYWERSDGSWEKLTFDQCGNTTSYEDSDGRKWSQDTSHLFHVAQVK